jgi:hypothetical protein
MEGITLRIELFEMRRIYRSCDGAPQSGRPKKESPDGLDLPAGLSFAELEAV